ncbi:MAG: flagellar biosynthetic protein FliR [Ilumatobacteraceae bacterium]
MAMQLDLSVDWALGLSLAVARSSAFIGLCPWVPRTIPSMGRTSLALALGLFIAGPIGLSVDASTGDLLTAAFVNVSLGALLGWMIGIPLQAFQVAGGVIDAASGISMGSVFDPDAGTSPGPISRAYTLTAQALLIGGGGLLVLTQVLWFSTQVIALDGRLGSMAGVSDAAIDTVNRLMAQGLQIALPIVAVLFLGELAFGLLNRLAPQFNMFLIGVPLKTLLTLSMLGTAATVFPRHVDRLVSTGTETVLQLLGG